MQFTQKQKVIAFTMCQALDKTLESVLLRAGEERNRASSGRAGQGARPRENGGWKWKRGWSLALAGSSRKLLPKPS